MREMEIWYNVTDGVLLDSSGTPVRSTRNPYIIFRELMLVKLHLVTDNDFTEFTDWSAADTFVAVIDYDFDHSTDVMCKTLDANINKAGDWNQSDSSSAAVADGADEDLGRFSIRLDANNSRFETVLGTAASRSGSQLELQAWEAGVLVGVVRMPFNTLNIMDDDGSVPPGLSSAYVTTGSVALGVGDAIASVSGLALASVPSVVLVSVRKPTDSSTLGSFNIFATVRDGSVTTDGFTVDLSGAPDMAGYKLDYALFA